MRGLHFESGSLDLASDLCKATEVILAADAHVLELEFLQSVLRRLQIILVALDLLIDELHRRARVGPLFPQTRFDEDGQQRLHHAFAAVRVRVAVTDDVEITRAPGQADASHDVVDQILLLPARFHAEIEIRHADELLDVRATDERAADERDLLLDVRPDRQPRQQRPKQRFGVDVDARTRLVLVGYAIDRYDCDDSGKPRRCEAEPSPVPHAAKVCQCLL